MALDGITIRAIVDELNNTLLNGKINKISQPEKEELLFTVNTPEGNKRMLISANASLPFIYLTSENKPAPITAPSFCMLLRKHIGAGRIVAIDQPSLERVIRFKIQHLNEMGDLSHKLLYVEIMGKHSNIIFCDEDNKILDAIKHVPASVSSVREVLPGRDYFVPAQEGKVNPFEVTKEYFFDVVMKKPVSISKALMGSLVGISPVIANEICYRAGYDADVATASCFDAEKEKLFTAFCTVLSSLENKQYSPVIYQDNMAPVEFAPIKLEIYSDKEAVDYTSMSQVLEEYFSKRNKYTNIKQKSTDLRKIVSNHIERTAKKLDLQEKQLKDTAKREKYKLYGEMLHTYGYSVEPGAKEVNVVNYYDNSDLKIPLDPTLTPAENAKKYFDKYSKLKRTEEALTEQLATTNHELELLKSIESELFIAENESDLSDIRRELQDYGFIKKGAQGKKEKSKKSRPMHFVDGNGYDIYVGKNNYQNEEVTFKIATGNDWWFHTKSVHGSHVIVKSNNGELPDSTFEYAAALAAYYSGARETPKVEIDYIQKKMVKKVASAASGFVIYHSNYSMVVTPSLEHVRLISNE